MTEAREYLKYLKGQALLREKWRLDLTYLTTLGVDVPAELLPFCK